MCTRSGAKPLSWFPRGVLGFYLAQRAPGAALAPPRCAVDSHTAKCGARQVSWYKELHVLPQPGVLLEGQD